MFLVILILKRSILLFFRIRSNGTVDLLYKLEEKANDQFEISGGWGAGMLVGTVGVRFNNFAMRNFFNLKEWRPYPSGDGQSLSIRAQSNGRFTSHITFHLLNHGWAEKNQIHFQFHFTGH